MESRYSDKKTRWISFNFLSYDAVQPAVSIEKSDAIVSDTTSFITDLGQYFQSLRKLIILFCSISRWFSGSCYCTTALFRKIIR